MPTTDVQVAISAATAGARVLRAMYGAPMARFDKTPTDFATAADLEAEKAIMDVLRAGRPGDRFVGEESGATGSESAARTWLVDPLCGTLNYAARTPLVAVNVALRVDGEVVVAAVADPFTGELFWTDGGLACVRRDGADEPLVPSAQSHIADVNLDQPYPNAPSFAGWKLLSTPAFMDAFRPRALSTTLALTWVAAGRRAVYVTDGDVSDSVHFSAGIALCRAAGALVTGLRGQPLHTGVGGLVAAADTESHARLVSIINEMFEP